MNKNDSERTVISIKTKLGEFILEGSRKGLYCLSFPHRHKKNKITTEASQSKLWKAADQLKKYLEGRSVDFGSLKIDYSDYTDSEVLVLKALAKVKAGKLVSYGELSQKAGFKRAARFVGSVMAKNRLPIILPCHRVVRSDGGLGGYSLGLSWKKRLLAMEKQSVKKVS